MGNFQSLNKIVLKNLPIEDLGVVFTKNEVVDGMLDLLNYRSSHDLSQIKVLEPSAGNGSFAVKIIERLIESSKNHGFSVDQALANVTFFEIDSRKAKLLHGLLERVFNTNGIETKPSDLIRTEDFLLSRNEGFDLIIGNPPYLRWESIPKPMRCTYKKLFRTFADRCDLYIPFFEKGLSLLRPNGKLSYICSNRWFKTKYGKGLRELISLSYRVDCIIDMSNTDAFQKKVTAYPSIITISNNYKSGVAFFHQSRSLREFQEISSVGIENFPGIEKLPPHNLWLNKLNDDLRQSQALKPIESQGFKIGIGVATGKDEVFIGEKLHEDIEEELLLPIITSKELKANKYQKSQKWLFNPFNENGQLVNLDRYPKASKYLTSFKSELIKRHIARKKPEFWYRTIDKIDPKLVKAYKILLPDITGNKKIFIDQGQYYPHHNLYYILGDTLDDLKVLASILMSDFVYRQMKILSSNMNGGYPRWQSQNLRRLRIPFISALKPHYYKSLLEAYDKQDLLQINSLVSLEKIEANLDYENSWTLFDPPFDFNEMNK